MSLADQIAFKEEDNRRLRRLVTEAAARADRMTRALAKLEPVPQLGYLTVPLYRCPTDCRGSDWTSNRWYHRNEIDHTDDCAYAAAVEWVAANPKEKT